MNYIVKLVAGMTIALGMTACTTVETASRAAPLNAPLAGMADAQGSAQFVPDIAVRQINVTVPHTLSVSEANTLKPKADIVWQEEKLGNRYEQVKAIMTESFQEGTAHLSGDQGVILDVVLVEFHAQTPKVRYTFGGKHEVQFMLTVRDANSGEILSPARLVDATFDAYGGDAAIVADREGITQKSRIVEHVKAAVTAELKKPFTL